MALKNFSRDEDSLTINNRAITEFGSDEPAVEFIPINEKGNMKLGKGGTSCAVYNIQRYQVSVHLMPGSDDASFLQELYNNNATNIELEWGLLSGGDEKSFKEGMFNNKQQDGRVAESASLTDEVFILNFNVVDFKP